MDDEPATPWIALGACAVAAAAAAALAFSACAAGANTVCPAIGWSNTLTVGLADGWPPVDGGALVVECSSRCGLMLGPTDEPDEVQVPLTGRSTVVQLEMTTPDSAALTVLGPDGTELAQLDADLDWRRVGGSEECGGPSAASVVVPAREAQISTTMSPSTSRTGNTWIGKAPLVEAPSDHRYA
jgi:hypothetical protein